jgi:predicted small metal-binding protein
MDAGKGTMKRWKVACEDGFEVISSKEHELVKYVQMHVKEHHMKDVSHADVMAMAKPA